MLSNFAKNVLTRTLRKPTVTSVRTNYPYSRYMVINRKQPDDLSKFERYAYLLMTGAVILSVPFYILYNIDEYKGKPKRN